jgi:hypothetical protein
MEQCPGRLDEPRRGEMSCSLGDGCAVYAHLTLYLATGDEVVGQQVRDAHENRGQPDWMAELDADAEPVG